MLARIQRLFVSKASQKHFMYIPFQKDELSEEVLNDILFFQKGHEYNGKYLKAIFHGEDKDSLSKLPENAKLYVLGHGINIAIETKMDTALSKVDLPYDSLKHLSFADWAYAVSGGKKSITIDTVAQRMISDGLLNSNHINIKLWFCDPNFKAFTIAKKFRNYFKNVTNTFKVDYYLNSTLYSPGIKEDQLHKWAKDKDTGHVQRASLIKQSIFIGNPDEHNIVIKSSDDTLEEKTNTQNSSLV